MSFFSIRSQDIKIIDNKLISEVSQDTRETISGLDENERVPIGTNGNEENLPQTSSSEKYIIAQKKGYKSTENPNIYYSEKSKKYYIWDEQKQKFIKDKYITEVGEDGGYKKLDDWNVEFYYDKDNNLTKKLTRIDRYSIEKGLEPTGYVFHYNPKDKKYYRYNYDRDDFLPQNEVKEVYKNGSYKTIDKNGNTNFYDVNNNKITEIEAKELKSTEVANFYYDKENNKYYHFDNKTGLATSSNISEFIHFKNTNYSLIIEDEKYYKWYTNQGRKIEIPEDEYFAMKNGFTKQDNGIYSKDNNTYRYNHETKKMELFGIDYEYEKTLNEKPDGKIDNCFQNSLGDCWLISTIQGLAKNDKGRKILEDSLYVDEKGNVTVHLKGPNKKYVISQERINQAIKNKTHSYGDKDVIAIELAVEDFLTAAYDNDKDPKQTKRNFNHYSFNYNPRYRYEKNSLDGGFNSNAIHILTGLESTELRKIKSYNDGYLVNKLAPQKGNFEEDVKKIIENKNNIVFASIKREEDISHAVIITRIDENYVYILDTQTKSHSNPYSTDSQEDSIKPQAYPIKKFFEELVSTITYTNLSTELTPEKINRKIAQRQADINWNNFIKN